MQPDIHKHIATPLEDDRATSIGSMQEKYGEDWICTSGDIHADRQTDKHANVCSSHFHAPVRMKLFKTGSIDVVKDCHSCFAIDLPSCVSKEGRIS